MINLRLIIGSVLAIGAFALNASGAFLSEYGQIQNVANYSAMPGNKLTNSPYANNFPRPVYVQGTDLDTSDCEQTVATLVAAYCSGVKNCVGMQLSDVRPILMVQLSRLPGHNYASACGGFIDSEFDRFISQYGNAAPQYKVAFPNATVPVNESDGKFQIKNPYEIKLNDWQIDYLERANELEQLQAINGAGFESVTKADFPEIFADLPFEERMAILADGYQQYKDATAYQQMDIESYEDYQKRVKSADATSKKKESADPAKQNSLTPKTEDFENIENLLPWYGILVVKKGSLDTVANSDTPLISSDYLKSHKDAFYPANSDRRFGLRRACTHGNHMANDNDVVNRAAHITMGQDDSFWKGSDFYVYDGEDVYWGWATIAGEVALALMTMGISAEVQAGTVAAQTSAATASAVVGASGKSVKAVNVIKDSAKVKKAATTAKNATTATKTQAIKELKDVGVELRNTAGYRQINRIGQILLDAEPSVSWVSSLKNPWKLVKAGATNIKPTTARLLGPGATWGTRFKTLATVGGVVGANYLLRELIKAFGYSTASLSMEQYGEQYKNLKFSGFGLLSDDDIEGRENEVSHGAWIQFEENGTVGDDDARDEALAWAEEFQKDMTLVNNSDPMCDVDIYVVQPAISKPRVNSDNREVFYLIMNPGASLRVSSGENK